MDARRVTLAAMATMPSRAKTLETALRSIRPQVDELRVYLNGFSEAPACVRELADSWIANPENTGAEAKFHWADSWKGVMLTIDDDLLYPPDYVSHLLREIERWEGRAIVTYHGRRFRGPVQRFQQGRPFTFYSMNPRGEWVNHAGTGVMGWDTRVISVPKNWPERNSVDAQLAVWAQEHEVPMWLPAHKGYWIQPLQRNGPDSIYRKAKDSDFAERNRVIARCPYWRVVSVIGQEEEAAYVAANVSSRS